MKFFRVMMLCCFGLLLGSCQDGELEITQAWLRPLPPGMAVTAGYARLSNHSAAPIELCAVRSAAFGSLELHRSELVDGMARMRQLHQFLIAPGEQVALEPGGLHLMLMQPTAPITLGEQVRFELDGCDGRRWQVVATVRDESP